MSYSMFCRGIIAWMWWICRHLLHKWSYQKCEDSPVSEDSPHHGTNQIKITSISKFLGSQMNSKQCKVALGITDRIPTNIAQIFEWKWSFGTKGINAEPNENRWKINTDMKCPVYTSGVTGRNGDTFECGLIGGVATTARATLAVESKKARK